MVQKINLQDYLTIEVLMKYTMCKKILEWKKTKHSQKLRVKVGLIHSKILALDNT